MLIHGLYKGILERVRMKLVDYELETCTFSVRLTSSDTVGFPDSAGKK